MKKLIINENKEIRKKSCELLLKQGEPQWMEAFRDSFEIVNLVKIEDPEADSLLEEVLFRKEFVEKLTKELYNIDEQKLERVFATMFSKTSMTDTDTELKANIAQVLK
ncbi:MAG: hypothetical protein AB1Z23_13205 [Eubacteriales bacterium]